MVKRIHRLAEFSLKTVNQAKSLSSFHLVLCGPKDRRSQAPAEVLLSSVSKNCSHNVAHTLDLPFSPCLGNPLFLLSPPLRHISTPHFFSSPQSLFPLNTDSAYLISQLQTDKFCFSCDFCEHLPPTELLSTLKFRG